MENNFSKFIETEVDIPLKNLNENLDYGDKTSMINYRISSATIPVILSAPHGGILGSGILKDRPKNKKDVLTKSDLFTQELTAAIDEYLRDRIGKTHIIMAKFHRRYIDANRNIENPTQYAINTDCEESFQIYNDYHSQIENSITHSLDAFPQSKCLLLDIHGMKRYNDYIIMGTRNGTTCKLDEFNHPYSGFIWHLRTLLGNSILPNVGDSDISQYSGGYTIQRHSGNNNNVNAIQLEFGSLLRSKEFRYKVSVAIGEAIFRFLKPMRLVLEVISKSSPTSINWSMQDVENKLILAQCNSPFDLKDINVKLNRIGEDKIDDNLLDIFLLELNVKSNISPPSLSSLLHSNLSIYQKSILRRIFLYNTLRDDIKDITNTNSKFINSGYSNAAIISGYKLYKSDDDINPICIKTSNNEDQIKGRIATFIDLDVFNLKFQDWIEYNQPYESNVMIDQAELIDEVNGNTLLCQVYIHHHDQSVLNHHQVVSCDDWQIYLEES
jgi:N-formylglutamate amidohydrolase